MCYKGLYFYSQRVEMWKSDTLLRAPVHYGALKFLKAVARIWIALWNTCQHLITRKCQNRICDRQVSITMLV